MSQKWPCIAGVPNFDFAVTEEAADSCVKLFIRAVKKSWDVEQLTKIIFNGGATNTLIVYYVSNPDDEKYETSDLKYGSSDIFLLKIYGANTDFMINRVQELQSFIELSKNNMAPKLYCTFMNGYCYEYIKGRVCSMEDFKDYKIMTFSAHCMARFHSIKLSDSYLKNHKMESSMFTTILQYMNLIPEKYENPHQQARFINEVPNVNKLRTEIDLMRSVLLKIPNKLIVFCHNDLNIPNLILDEKKEIMHCIDYEYAAPNYAAYDIANHFNEFAGNNEIDFELLPNEETQKYWLEKYLEKFKAKSVEVSVSEQDVNMLHVQVQYFLLVSHFLWGVWALVQASISQIEFDYLGYGIIRLYEYFKRRDDILKYVEEYVQ